jgi:hypothetical protein
MLRTEVRRPKMNCPMVWRRPPMTHVGQERSFANDSYEASEVIMRW